MPSNSPAGKKHVYHNPSSCPGTQTHTFAYLARCPPRCPYLLRAPLHLATYFAQGLPRDGFTSRNGFTLRLNLLTLPHWEMSRIRYLMPVVNFTESVRCTRLKCHGIGARGPFEMSRNRCATPVLNVTESVRYTILNVTGSVCYARLKFHGIGALHPMSWGWCAVPVSNVTESVRCSRHVTESVPYALV